MILFQEKVSFDFIAKAQEVANKLSIPVNWLMAVIDLETAGTFNPAITNSLGYTGLIQFGVSTAQSLGTTTAQLRLMSAVEQLDYVYKYLAPYKSKFANYVDLYFAVFFPLAMKKASDFVLQTLGTSAYKIAIANPLFDINKDGKITVSEVEQKLFNRIPISFLDEFKKKVLICQCCGQSYSV